MANFYDAFDVRPFTLWLDVQVTSQSVELNRSYVSWVLRIRKDGNSTPFNNTASPWSVTIAGQNWKGNYAYNMNQAVGATVQVASGGRMVYHNSDGTMAIGVESYFNDTAGQLDYAFLSGSMGLPTIPRASTPSFSDNDIEFGSAVTINTNRASGDFTHTIKYVFGADSGTIATGVGASHSWTPPLGLMEQIPNSTSAYVGITLDTYSGATLIGTKTVTILKLNVPAAIVPDFTTVTHSESVAGVASAVGAYVQGVSKPSVAITGAVGVYGSTISAYKIQVGSQIINAASGTVGNPLASSGVVAVIGTVTDSRGRSYSKTVNINVLAYLPPAVVATTQRALSNGAPDDEGEYIRFNLDADVSSLLNGAERNSLTYRLYAKARGATTWTLLDTTTPTGVSFTGAEWFGVYPVTDAYDTRVEVVDLFSTTALQSSVAVAAVFMHWDGAEGVGVGKYRENGRLDVNGDAFFSDDVNSSTGVRVGPADGANVRIEPNKITALNNGADAALEINPTGGDVTIGDSTTTVVIDGNIDNPNLPYKALSGRTTSTGSSSSNAGGVVYWDTGTTISFPPGFFTQAPVVTVSVEMQSFVVWSSIHVAPTISGFGVRLMRAGGAIGSGYTINWTAVQQDP